MRKQSMAGIWMAAVLAVSTLTPSVSMAGEVSGTFNGGIDWQGGGALAPGESMAPDMDAIPANGASLQGISDGVQMGLKGTDQIQTAGDQISLEEMGLTFRVPEGVTLGFSDSDQCAYLYPMEEGYIPYVIIGVYEYEQEDVFLEDFTVYMKQEYPDLSVISEPKESMIGSTKVWETSYQYTISGYTAADRRVAIAHNGLVYMLGSKEIPELDCVTGDLLDTVVKSLQFTDESGSGQEPNSTAGQSDDKNGGILNLGGTTKDKNNGQTTAKTQTEVPYVLTSIVDEESQATVARCYAPQNYSIWTQTLWWGTGKWQSPSSPIQVQIVATSADEQCQMAYLSGVSYAYSDLFEQQGLYREGELYYGIYPMLTPMYASEYADFMMQQLLPGITVTFEEEQPGTDEQVQWLTEQAQQLYDYMNQSGGSAAGVTIDGTVCTAADRTYSFVYEGTPYRANIITYTSIIQESLTVGSLSSLLYFWGSPYTYVYWAPEAQYEEGKADFDLFAANTSVSDAFLVAVGNLSTELAAEISLGKSATANDIVSGLSSEMSSAEDTYSDERFTDYILSQNSYTTSDGSVIKVPNSYDYVYEGSDGTIYVSNSADEPAGSTRLYGN